MTAIKKINSEQTEGMLDNFQLQGKKIQKLLLENESLANKMLKLEEEIGNIKEQSTYESLRDLQGQIEQLNQALRTVEEHRRALLPWRDALGERLGGDFTVCIERVSLLEANLVAIRSPLHRIASFFERFLRKTMIGRGVLRLLNFSFALYKA